MPVITNKLSEPWISNVSRLLRGMMGRQMASITEEARITIWLSVRNGTDQTTGELLHVTAITADNILRNKKL